MKTLPIDDDRFSDLINLENTILELNSRKDTSIQEVLTAYLQGIENYFPHLKCSIHQVKNNRLFNWASPSIPQPFLDFIENIEIGLNVGSCGTAAYLNERVIVSDITNDPRWATYKVQALANQLLACWSHPITNREGTVIATFAIYYDHIKTPDEFELKIIDRSVAIIKVIVENRQNTEIIREATLLMKQGQELAHFGTWQWDIANNVVTWSDSLYNIYGLDKSSFAATFEGYQQLLHPDDRPYVTRQIQQALATRTDTTFEERIIRPTGEQRYLRSWGKVQTDKKGAPVKMIGACLDITENKKVEEELLASESRLRSIVDAQTNYVIRTDLKGNYTYYNNRYAEDFGWLFDHKPFIGANCLTTVLPDHRQRVTDLSTNCQQHPHQLYQVELDTLQQEGGIKSILWHFICLTDSRDEPSEIQCIGLDVSERKQVEDALRKSNERYEYVNRATNDAIYDWDIIANHIEWGEGFFRLFGYSTGHENYPIEKWASLIHSADKEKIVISLRTHLQNPDQLQWTVTYRYLKADGTYAYTEDNGLIIRDKSGKAIRMIGVMRDITRQKREEEHLRLLESVVTNTNDSVLIAESDPEDVTGLKIRYINPTLSAISGYTAEELIGKSPSVLINEASDESIFRPAITSTLTDKKPTVIESLWHRKNGEKVWVNLSISPVMDQNGTLTHWIFIGHDVTERLNYIKAIEEKNQKLQEIAWMQSHVIRAPLARLMGFVNLLKNYPASESEKTEFLEHLLSSAHQLDDVIRNISDKTNQI